MQTKLSPKIRVIVKKKRKKEGVETCSVPPDKALTKFLGKHMEHCTEEYGPPVSHWAPGSV